jgi:predicted HicB family RNase H-like nuclease
MTQNLARNATFKEHSGKQVMRKADRYLKIVEWSEEDQCYVGTSPGLMIGGVHGSDETKVFKDLCEVVEEWIKIHEADKDPLPPETAGKDYSGKFVLRVGKELHKKIALDAMRAGKSLNAYCIQIIKNTKRFGNRRPKSTT